MSDMKIKFSVHQNPLKDKEGRTTYQVRQDTLGAIDTKGLESLLALHSMQNNFTLGLAVEWIQKQMVSQMNFNRRVHLNGIGTFSLNIGMKPVIDEDGTKHKRIVTDPKEITGNDLEVTGVNFVPDKELIEKLKSELVYFEHSDPRGSVGHSAWYTDEQMRQSIIDWFGENNYLTRPLFSKMWHITLYKAGQWLKQLSEGENALLVRSKQSGTFFYYLKPNS